MNKTTWRIAEDGAFIFEHNGNFIARFETVEEMAEHLAWLDTTQREITTKLPKCWRLNENRLVQDVPVILGNDYYYICKHTGIRHGQIHGMKLTPHGPIMSIVVWASELYLQGQRNILAIELYNTREAARYGSSK